MNIWRWKCAGAILGESLDPVSVAAECLLTGICRRRALCVAPLKLRAWQ